MNGISLTTLLESLVSDWVQLSCPKTLNGSTYSTCQAFATRTQLCFHHILITPEQLKDVHDKEVM